MPCVRCAARQTDPVRGASTWKRGVQGGRQVLICSDCQRDHDWAAELDACPSCGSTMLVRALGETRCRACSAVQVERPPPPANLNEAPGLAEDVSAALQRVLHRRDPS